MSVLVLENGAATIKAGLSTSGMTEPRIIPNAVVRSKGDKATYIGHEIQDCQDFASLHYHLPFEKGFVTDWDAQKAVWDGLMSPQVFGVDPLETSLLVTEPYFNMSNIQDVYDQFVFEEYEFQSCLRCCRAWAELISGVAAAMIPNGEMFNRSNSPPPDCMLVVDSGFSYTHVVPLMNGSILWEAITRIDVGGKLLTNHLKELVSFRQWNMMEETHVMNEVKELCCFVTTNMKTDLEACRSNNVQNNIVQEYVLPDFSSRRLGRLRKQGEHLSDTDQILRMSNERFLVPEILFRPDDIGLAQVGIPQAIVHSIGLLQPKLQGLFWANIGVVGGSAKFPGFHERLLVELRALAPIDCEVEVFIPSDPVTEAYKSALAFAQSPVFREVAVTRAEYLEHGSNICRKRFRGWNSGVLAEDKGKGKNQEVAPEDSDSDSDSTAARRISRRSGRQGRRGHP